MPRLIFRRSGDRADAVQEFELPQGQVVVGRAEDADVILDNQTVSRHHAVIARTTQGFVLTDSGSANGTWVNKKRITSVVLRHGDAISFGTVAVVFDEPPDPSATLMVDIAAVLDEVEEVRVAEGLPSSSRSAAPVRRNSPTVVEPPPPHVASIRAGGREGGDSLDSPPGKPHPPARPAPPPMRPPPAQAMSTSVADQELHRTPLPEPPPVGRRPMSTPVRTVSSPAKPHYAGFWIRVLSMLIDSAAIGLVSVALWAGSVALAGVVGGRGSAIGSLLVFGAWGLTAVLPPLYFVVGWVRSGRTLGKRACGLRVRSDDGGGVSVGAAFLRLLGTMASSAILGIGYLMVAFTDRKRGLHDMIAGTVVVREAR